ncbi:hypothetical protein BJ138DRAFT_982906, partial [Hygrophoropsis aurantiaca]
WIQENGIRKAFHLGGNSSCCQHVWSHYDIYRERCIEKCIWENHHAVPRPLVKQREEAKKAKK